MTEERANKVYDVLVKEGGAQEGSRSGFVHAHTLDDCEEYRFCGHLGSGGKFRSGRMRVDCYPEDENPERLKMITTVNTYLAEI